MPHSSHTIADRPSPQADRPPGRHHCACSPWLPRPGHSCSSLPPGKPPRAASLEADHPGQGPPSGTLTTLGTNASCHTEHGKPRSKLAEGPSGPQPPPEVAPSSDSRTTQESEAWRGKVLAGTAGPEDRDGSSAVLSPEWVGPPTCRICVLPSPAWPEAQSQVPAGHRPCSDSTR